MTGTHADREHATWSASSTKRHWACPGALALAVGLPERTSEAADWGTCAHQISEACLLDGSDAERFIGAMQKGKQHEFEVDEEMADCAQAYVDYVRKTVAAASPLKATLWVEEKFSLAAIKPPFAAGGTADAVIYKPGAQELEVVDLKGGRGVVVDVKENPQLRTYALGTMLHHKGLDVERVTVTIVQPRAPHKDGRIRSETFHVADLAEWAADLLVAMRRAKCALDDRTGMGPLQWAAKYLRPGDHCRDTFCPAAGFCPALEQRAAEAVGLHFDPITEAPSLRNSPESGTPEERAARLDMLDMIDDWVKAVRAHEHRMAEMGQPATGYGLVEKTGREKWIDGGAEKALAAADLIGLAPAKVQNEPRPKTPKQVREAFKKAGADTSALDGLSITPNTGTNLVKLSTSLRPPIMAPANQHFTAIEE